MDLPSTYHYHGWQIRYSLANSNGTNTQSQRPAKYVVFVHGTPWSSIVFRPIVEALRAKLSYHILVYDLPGYGQSQTFNSQAGSTTSEDDFPGDTSVKFQAQALAGLLTHTQLDGKDGHPTPSIVAHDIAGTIVLRAHLLHGCEFDTMLLVDANTVLPWGDGFYKHARSDPQPYVRLPPNIFEAVVRAVIQSACHKPKVLQNDWEDLLARPWIDDSTDTAQSKERQRSFVRQIAQANDADVAEMLESNMYERVRCDVKIIWGEQDQWIPKAKIEELIKRMKGRVKESVFIPEAGHLVMLDQPEKFAIEVLDWLTQFASSQSFVTP